MNIEQINNRYISHENWYYIQMQSDFINNITGNEGSTVVCSWKNTKPFQSYGLSFGLQNESFFVLILHRTHLTTYKCNYVLAKIFKINHQIVQMWNYTFHLWYYTSYYPGYNCRNGNSTKNRNRRGSDWIQRSLWYCIQFDWIWWQWPIKGDYNCSISIARNVFESLYRVYKIQRWFFNALFFQLTWSVFCNQRVSFNPETWDNHSITRNHIWYW